MGKLRIIGGEWRSRLIDSPEGMDTAPSPTAFAKAFFDCLGQRLDGLVLADCFAGSGSFGFEALSRGASEVHAVEMGPHALKALKANAQSLNCQDRHRVHARPLPQAADGIPLCDIIFADPPFPWFREQPDVLAEVLAALLQRLAPDGELIVRGERGEILPTVANASIQQRREYGRSWMVWLTAAA